MRKNVTNIAMADTCAESYTRNVYKKREGTTAIEGHTFERLICLQVISQSIDKGYQFELKSNVEGEEKIFDDVICKIMKNSSVPDKVRHLFLQAKHMTGKNPTIFKISRDVGEKTYPTPDICKWFESYLQLSKDYPCEDFEMIFFTTADIEQKWKCHFEEADSIFSDIFPVHQLDQRNEKSGKIYELKNCIAYLLPKFGELASAEVVSKFIKSMKIFTCQPKNEKLSKLIRQGISKRFHIKINLVFNEASRYMEQWQSSKGEVQVITHDIFAEAHRNIGTEILKHVVSLDKEEGEFTYTSETVSKFYRQISGTSSQPLCFSYSEIYKDLLKQTIREKEPISSFLVFQLKYLLLIIDQVSSTFDSNQISTYLCIEVFERNFSRNNNKAKENIQDLIDKLGSMPNVYLIFLIEHSLLLSKHISETLSRHFQSITLDCENLDQDTRTKVLEYDVTFFGQNVTLDKLQAENEEIIDGEMLGEIRRGATISIGDAIKMNENSRSTYIERTLMGYCKIDDPKKFLERIYLSDKKAESSDGEVKRVRNLTSVDQSDEFENIPMQAGHMPRPKERQSQMGKVFKDKYVIFVAEQDSVKSSSETTTSSNSDANAQTKNLFFETEPRKALEKYNNLSKLESEQGVHLLQQENGKIYLLKSGNKCLDDLQPWINYHSPLEITEDTLIQNTIKSSLTPKVLLVSSNAGMGKSTLATSLAAKLPKDGYWPILINLNKYQNVLNEIKNLQKNPEFLLQMFLDKTQLAIFKRFTRKSVVVILDGLDEIAPLFTDLVLRLVKELSSSDVQKVIVLTRKHMEMEFFKSIRALLFDLKKFDDSDIEKYFFKTFTPTVEPESDQQKHELLKEFVLKLKNLTFSNSRSQWLEISGVPLQAYMIAEIFRERCDRFLETQSEEHLPSEKDANMNLYEKMIESKLTVYMKEKQGQSLNAISVSKDKMFTDMFEIHSTLAIILIFGEKWSIKYFHINMQQIEKENPEELIRQGIVTFLNLSEGRIEFIHRSFAEYFCAARIAEILKRSRSIKIMKFIFKEIFLDRKYIIVRKFLDMTLEKRSLCRNFKYLNSIPFKIPFFPPQTNKYMDAFELYKDENCLLFLHELLAYMPSLLNYKNEYGQTPLHHAARGGYTEMVRLLLEQGADHKARNMWGRTPLHIAAYYGQFHVVRQLSEAGCDLCTGDNDGYTPLHTAAKYGKVECVRVLVELGAEVDVRDKFGYTPLHLAAGDNQIDCVRVLLEVGADTNASNKCGWTPLTVAREFGKTEMIEFLQSRGATEEITSSE